jgi:site-specific recombinase XerD
MTPTAVIIRERQDQHRRDIWQAITALVLDGLASQNTRRAYSQALEEFLIWFRDEPGREFTKAAVQKYRAELQIKGLAPSSINVRLSAIRRLALEAADNGLIGPELAAGIARAKGVKRAGVRLGHWLTAAQAEQMLAAPDRSTLKGLRDSAALALLLAAGLRRSELAGLTIEQIQLREGRWLIIDVTGKHGRIRSVPIPEWAYCWIAEWCRAATITVGPLFRRVTRHGGVAAQGISPQTVFEIVTDYARMIAPGCAT